MPNSTFFNLDSKKQALILEAAIVEFSKAPYKKVTVNSIVKRANIAKGSFYQYFENKQDLYKHLFKKISEQKYDILNQHLKQMNSIKFSVFIRKLYRIGMNFDFQDSSHTNLREKFLYYCSSELQSDVLEMMIPKSNELFTYILKFYIEKGELDPTIDINVTAEMMTALTIFSGKNIKGDTLDEKKHLIHKIDCMISIIEKGILGS